MKIVLLSDVHANLPALEAVLAELEGQHDVDAHYHLGDLVGYAPWPNEVVALLRERGIGRRERRARSDETAAVIILEDYLAESERRRLSGERTSLGAIDS